jgi:hypothetical protein
MLITRSAHYALAKSATGSDPGSAERSPSGPQGYGALANARVPPRSLWGFELCQFLRHDARFLPAWRPVYRSTSHARRNSRSRAVFLRSASGRCSYSGREAGFRCPLSASAALPEGKPYRFSTDGGATPISGFSKFKAAFDEASGVADWTLHDLRRTARSLMSRAGVSADIAERVPIRSGACVEFTIAMLI